MEIEFNPSLTVTNNPVGPSTVRPVSTQPGENAMPFENTQALEQTLKETSNVRPDVVSKAAALLSDPNWPSDESLNRVASVLAQNITGQQG
ncbi:MAG TPA: hypothetical protein VNU95_02405 [Candidatus Acidoferrales bacterium]|jgi:hypothetical protein|nr:hypothetical protein [Candidatus Acidoferrales bacterium]